MCSLWTDLSSPSVLFFLMGTGKQNLSKTCSNPSKQGSKNYDQYPLASFCFPLYQTLQLLKFDDIVKLQLAKIMHSVHNNNISNLYFGFSKVENFFIIALELLQIQTLSKLLQELKKANQPFLSQAQKYGVRYLVIWKVFLITPLNINIRGDCLTAILNN